MSHACEDCGAPVEIKTSGKPPMDVAYDADGHYHDMSACVRYLAARLRELEAKIAAQPGDTDVDGAGAWYEHGG